jgi:hypothetical protein
MFFFSFKIKFSMLVLVLIGRIEDSDQVDNVGNSSNYVYRSLIFPSYEHYTSLSLKVFSYFWLFFVYIVLQIFASQISSDFTVDKMSQKINSLEDLVMVSSGEVEFNLMCLKYLDDFFLCFQQSAIRPIWNKWTDIFLRNQRSDIAKKLVKLHEGMGVWQGVAMDFLEYC